MKGAKIIEDHDIPQSVDRMSGISLKILPQPDLNTPAICQTTVLFGSFFSSFLGSSLSSWGNSGLGRKSYLVEYLPCTFWCSQIKEFNLMK